ncbi:hypothetical protein VMCG_07288 [Cytospora schulzeri]|uniref:NADP-dependent oxidoreductase domain-containing protein n=1 Tax=Cytospora schulzeri TaxID=448051 RepID=A0A423WAN2_9PEZI|nr:hypothetical protein VMCG_07288 [Valsa malicola]
MASRFALNCAKHSAGTIPLPNLCIGSWSWGDSITWKNSSKEAVAELEGAWTSMRESDLFFVDTAEVYGRGESERIIGRLRQNPESTTDDFRSRLVIASKFIPIPWPPTRLILPGGMVKACKASLARLGMDKMDLYQIHGPTHFLNSIDTMASSLARCVVLGLTRAVGVSNYSRDEMVEMDDALRRRGLRLASNQVEFSLLRTLPEKSGLLEECKKRGIVLMAYSPLGMGRLTGKYSKENPPPSGRSFGNFPMEQLAPLLEALRGIAEAHNVKSSAVALKWVIQKGAIPLGGVKNASQAEENARAASDDWTLSEEQMAELDSHALALVALLAFALSFGVYRPAGPITLHAIPAVNNPVWLLTFAILGIGCFIWAVVGVWQLGVVRHLEQNPTFFRFWILFDLALELACAGVVTAYIISVLRNADGCLNRSKQGCSTAWAFTIFEALWVLVEAISFVVLIAKYIGRDKIYERPDRKGEWKIWLRGAQVLCTSLSVALATLLYLPTGIPVIDGVHSPSIAWVLLMGAILCGIFWPWHLAMCFPGIQRSLYRSYGLYVFYVVMECLALVAFLGLGVVYAWKFITKGSACADLGQQGCPAVLATDAFTSIGGVMQIVQIIALLFLLDERPRRPVNEKVPKEPKPYKQRQRPKQRYQPPAPNAYPHESYLPPSYPSESYPPPNYAQQSYPQAIHTQNRRPRQMYPQKTYPLESYPGLKPPPPSYAFNKRHLDRELEEAQLREQLNKEQWKREVERLRAESKAHRDAQKRAAKRQQELEIASGKERKREEKLERLRKQAQMRQEHAERLQKESQEEELLEYNEYAGMRPDEIERLQDRVREEGDQLLRIMELQRQAGPRRQIPQEIPPPPSI